MILACCASQLCCYQTLVFIAYWLKSLSFWHENPLNHKSYVTVMLEWMSQSDGLLSDWHAAARGQPQWCFRSLCHHRVYIGKRLTTPPASSFWAPSWRKSAWEVASSCWRRFWPLCHWMPVFPPSAPPALSTLPPPPLLLLRYDMFSGEPAHLSSSFLIVLLLSVNNPLSAPPPPPLISINLSEY